MSEQLGQRSVARATAYSGAAASAFAVPADLSTLDDEALQALHTAGTVEFDNLYGDGSSISDEAIVRLRALTQDIETLSTEIENRQTLAAERNAEAAEFARKVKGKKNDDEDDKGKAAAETSTLSAAEPEQFEAIEVSEDGSTLVASAADGRKFNVVLPKGRNRDEVSAAARQALASQTPKRSMGDVAQLTGEGLGVRAGSGVGSFEDMGKALDRKLATFNAGQYSNAAATGRDLREIGQFASFRREMPASLVVSSNDKAHVDEVLKAATNERNLSGGSLLASGGWHAPSEILYNEYLELESRDGIMSVPEIGVARGGVQITPGPSFADIYKNLGIPYFHFSEAQDIAGDYATNASGTSVVGPKPVYKVTPPDFTDHRLGVDGLIIQSGLLAARGYPEHLARVIRGALVAHDHKINTGVIAAIAAGSTAVSLAANQVGAAAPVLTAIELQVEHYKTTSRMARGTTLEAVFPFWIRGAIRSDLSRRMGVNFFDVPDAMINGWFTDRGVAAQYVYDWQSIDVNSTAAQFTQWPTTVSFLLYAAGTWVKGTSDVLTLDTLYDSTLLGDNDFTALFTEEGWFVAQAGVDSRLVTTSISATGSTHIGEEILNDGALV